MIKRKLYAELIDHLSQKEMSLIIGPRQAGKTTLMEMLKDLSRGTPLLVGFNRDGCAVRVRAGDHEHLVALQSMVASEYIGW